MHLCQYFLFYIPFYPIYNLGIYHTYVSYLYRYGARGKKNFFFIIIYFHFCFGHRFLLALKCSKLASEFSGGNFWPRYGPPNILLNDLLGPDPPTPEKWWRSHPDIVKYLFLILLIYSSSYRQTEWKTSQMRLYESFSKKRFAWWEAYVMHNNNLLSIKMRDINNLKYYR